MQGYLLRRLLASIPVLVVVALITFGLIHLAPGDPAALMLGPLEATPEQIAKTREHLGLDKPLWQQGGIWLARALRGDLGDSIFLPRTVLRAILERLEPSLSLAVLGATVAVALGIPLGVLAAWRAHTWIDRGVMVFAVLGFSIPVFFLALILMLVFGVALRWLPVVGYENISAGLWPWLSHLILPSITIGLVSSALIARMTRASMLDVLREDYIRTARAKGLAEQVVLLRHALRNAFTPILTVIGLSFAALVAGVVITETMFALPGVGRLIVGSIFTRDYPVIQGVMLLVAAIYVFINLAVDIMYSYVDPRIRY